MKHLALALIRGYQRFLSPLKGFSCAFRVYTEGCSCSAYGYRVIEKHGLRLGLRLLQRRLDRCAWHHREHHKAATRRQVLPGQAGHCDAGEVCACGLEALPSDTLPCACNTLAECGGRDGARREDRRRDGRSFRQAAARDRGHAGD